MDRLQTLARHICNVRGDTASASLCQLHLTSCRSNVEPNRVPGLCVLYLKLKSYATNGKTDPEPSGRPVLIGGMVLDVMAAPSGGAPLLRGSTVPGKVRYVNGGVARNVAECMAMLGSHPLLISVVGKDPAGEALLSHWRSLSLTTEDRATGAGIRQLACVSTPVVTAVFDDKGEVAAAIADVDTLEQHLSVDWVLKFAPHIQSAPVLLMDANLAPPVLEAAARVAWGANVPIWFEPVSVAKALRGAFILNKLTYISPNEAELVALSSSLPPPPPLSPHKPLNTKLDPLTTSHLSCPHPDPESFHALLARLEPHIKRLLFAGVRNVVLTLGAKGALLSHLNDLPGGSNPQPHFPEISHWHMPALAANPVNLSGAGDCLVGGALTAVMNKGRLGGHSRREVGGLLGPGGGNNQNLDQGLVAVSWGISVAKLSVESDQNVPWGGDGGLNRVAGKRGKRGSSCWDDDSMLVLSRG